VAFNVLTAESLAAYQWGSNFQVCSALPVSAVPELQPEGSVAFHSLSATQCLELRPEGQLRDSWPVKLSKLHWPAVAAAVLLEAGARLY
jgi:hypothetical protein